MNAPIPFMKADYFLNKLKEAKSVEDLKNLAKEIENYISINRNDEESKLILADIYITLGEINLGSSVLNQINFPKLKEDKKVEYMAYLLAVGDIKEALEVAKNINKNALNHESKLLFSFLFLEIALDLKNYEMALNILKELWEELYEEKFTYDKFFKNLDDFLIKLEVLFKIKGVSFILQNLILYIKAQKEVERNEIYKKLLEIGKKVLEKEFNNFNVFFEMSTDEDIMTMVVDINDKQVLPKELIPMKISINKKIREEIKKQIKEVPLFAVKVYIPVLKEDIGEKVIAT